MSVSNQSVFAASDWLDPSPSDSLGSGVRVLAKVILLWLFGERSQVLATEVNFILEGPVDVSLSHLTQGHCVR